MNDYENNTLKLITKEAAAEAVKKGELDIFKLHKLNQIVSYYYTEIDEQDQRTVVIRVNSTTNKEMIATEYFEHLSFKKFGDKWYIVKVERDI